MDGKKILVTGIGGNVGQGIVRNLKAEYPNFSFIGTDISSFNSGTFLCDTTYQVPYAYAADYIPTMQEIITKNAIDLIIPSTDYEVLYLSKHQHEIDGLIACMPYKMAKIFTDKFLTYQFFKSHNIPFATSWEIEHYDYSESEIIVKPKEGRGSRGIYKNPKNVSEFDASYMIQKLYQGPEYTTSVYVDKKGQIHSVITMLRTLENGTTVFAQVVDDHKDEIYSIVEKMVGLGSIRGSFNIQSIYQKGIWPFEINGRISGTNSIRHILGFKDCVWTVEEFLFSTPLKKPEIKKGIATRILMDTIYVGVDSMEEIHRNHPPYILH